MVDPSQWIQMMVYQQMMASSSSSSSSSYVMYLAALWYLGPTLWTWFHYLFGKDDTTVFVIVPPHKKKCMIDRYSSMRTMVKFKYSPRFKALTHFLLTQPTYVAQLCEVLELSDDMLKYNAKDEFVLMPCQNRQIQVGDGLVLEIQATQGMSDDDDDGGNDDAKKGHHNKGTKKEGQPKAFQYKLSSTTGDVQALHRFLGECETAYARHLKDDRTTQYLYEYLQTEQEDEDRKQAKYTETVFRSNKDFDVNVFFPEKEAFVAQVDKFVVDVERHQAAYAYCGQPYKFVAMLHGPPGTGKSSIIRAMLNRTKRDGVYVPWPNIKTCSELASVLRGTQYNGKTRALDDLLFIFEDVDANRSMVLKKRVDETKDGTEGKDKDKERDEKTLLEALLKQPPVPPPCHENELTLDYVLNMIDGIHEMHGAMMVFTTNHLESLDPALFRPGRVDVLLELKPMVPATMVQMLRHRYYNNKDNKDEDNLDESRLLELVVNKGWTKTPAEMQQLCWQHATLDSLLSSM